MLVIHTLIDQFSRHAAFLRWRDFFEQVGIYSTVGSTYRNLGVEPMYLAE